MKNDNQFDLLTIVQGGEWRSGLYTPGPNFKMNGHMHAILDTYSLQLIAVTGPKLKDGSDADEESRAEAILMASSKRMFVLLCELSNASTHEQLVELKHKAEKFINDTNNFKFVK